MVFPQTELGGDAGAVRAYGEAVEALGYRHILVYDRAHHVPRTVRDVRLPGRGHPDRGADPRLRLGVGIGWNAVEYGALGENFTDRGKRSEEQIALLRRLWTEQTVTFDGWFPMTRPGPTLDHALTLVVLTRLSGLL